MLEKPYKTLDISVSTANAGFPTRISVSQQATMEGMMNLPEIANFSDTQNKEYFNLIKNDLKVSLNL